MKTQINNLVNGQKLVIGRTEGFKGGSNFNLRSEVAISVISEHGDTMKVSVNGVALELNRTQSVSGKTITFESEITKDQFAQILGFESDITGESSFLFTINNQMTCQIDRFARKNDNCQWKHRGYTNVAERLVNIL
jgi:hypothetical protein